MQEWVRVYHGSVNDAAAILAAGLDAWRLPTWITRDFAAARNVIDPMVRADRVLGSGIIKARIPKFEFEAVLARSERSYSGFNSAVLSSTEIVLRTAEQVALFNQHIVR